MNRPTISLAMIVKNERHNLPQLFDSIKDCFDEVHITDTGSSDGTVEWLKEHGAQACGAKVLVHHFDWINDFAAARNYSFSHVKTDFVMWLDGDDILKNREEFILWRDTAMEFADIWLATYHYAHDPETGKAVVSFARERVMKVSKGPVWKYFIHEGVVPAPDWRLNYITTWSVKHMRNEQDRKNDQNRNIKIMESRKHEFDGRMTFYYGKELFETHQFDKAIDLLTKAASLPDCEPHDRILALQYAAYSAIFEADKMKPEHQGEKLFMAIRLAQQGSLLAPNRAEFYCIVGDAYVKLNKLQEALPYFAAAQHCKPTSQEGQAYAGVIYSAGSCYNEIPMLNKAKIYYHLGDLENSEREARECWTKFGNKEAGQMLIELDRIKPLVELNRDQTPCSDIVFSCPPLIAYPFDEEIYKTKPLGGSETALVQVAAWLKKLTDRRVIVFNTREDDLVAESGVEYISNKKLNEYMAQHRPAVHIAWRHNIRVTNAPTYLWCHDLTTPGVESMQNFDKIMCLSLFHRDYVRAMQGVPIEKIMLTRNGLDPEKINSVVRKPKDPNKIVWMSSPDRGLKECLLVMDRLVRVKPDLKLHVYYGLDNLYKYGLSELADQLKAMMKDRPYVVYHGFTEQSKMYHEVSDAVVWLHPCNFIETFAITAIEMLALGIYPVAHRLGALANTLANAESNGQATMLDHGGENEIELAAYASATIDVLEQKKWQRVSLDPNTISWRGVAEQWIKEMELG